ncbi:hypothetical protein EJ02DRAFT_366614 [Clathrospora elynae]|uniref:Uncharacterized protein n=1 Tax=Clathrospora elynae TaxID=706981 RepID=A0A6A5T1Z8_9PLEO|nr:hypothetical protein EJ02DRAFT_366614 [Clathrospora elynae]
MLNYSQGFYAAGVYGTWSDMLIMSATLQVFFSLGGCFFSEIPSPISTRTVANRLI